jgi:hypothetical protein
MLRIEAKDNREATTCGKCLTIEQFKTIGYAPELILDVVTSVADKMKRQLRQLEDERLALGRDTARWNSDIRKTSALISPNETDSPAIARLAACLASLVTWPSRSTTKTLSAKAMFMTIQRSPHSDTLLVRG